MFNDKYGLTQAVLEGRKTMTRRIVPQSALDKVEEYRNIYYSATFDYISTEEALLNMATAEGMVKSVYKVGEVVAIAQPYKDLVDNPYFLNKLEANEDLVDIMKEKAGWNNKMFVSSYYLPNKIRITDIKVERLQDISYVDCFEEGILQSNKYAMPFGIYDSKAPNKVFFYYSEPQEAFASLIDKVSGNGTWDSNPFVFVYSFELVK